MSSNNIWEVFFAVNLSFPVVFFTFFLVLAVIYWCIAALGLIDLDVLDADTDMDMELDASPDVGSVSGLLLRLGLNGVPITIIITLIAFFGWLISSITVHYAFPFIPTVLLKSIVGLGVLLGTLLLATYLTAFTIKPIRPFFLTANQQKVVHIVGQTAIVRTGTVNETFGEANLNDGGAGLIVKIRAYPNQSFQRGDRVVIIEQDTSDNTYKVISEEEYTN